MGMLKIRFYSQYHKAQIESLIDIYINHVAEVGQEETAYDTYMRGAYRSMRQALALFVRDEATGGYTGTLAPELREFWDNIIELHAEYVQQDFEERPESLYGFEVLQ